MPTNWPPAGAPTWPPPEIGPLQCSDLKSLILALREAGFAQAAPTAAENQAYFNNARCDHGDRVVGRMLISPGGARYPFAVCNDAGHRDLLVLWPPYYAGFRAGLE